MNKKLFIIISFIVITAQVAAQSFKDWNTYLAYNDATGVAETGDRVFVLANGSLYSYGKDDAEIILYSKQNGLSDTDIKIIRYSTYNQTLVIVYNNGNIDLLDSDGIKNMPDLKNASGIQSKVVNDIYFYDNRAYLATDFGVLALNLSKKEVLDTYRLDRIVNSVCIIGDNIYASTTEGILTASINDNLLDRNMWKEKTVNHQDITTSNILRIRSFDNHLIYCVSQKGIYYDTAEGEVKRLLDHSYIKDINCQSTKLIAYTTENLYIFYALDRYDYIHFGVINDVSTLTENDTYWIVSGAEGLTAIKKGNNEFTKIVSNITINSPKRNYNAFMTIHNGKLLIVGGGRSSDRYRFPGTLMTYKDGEWFNFNETLVDKETMKLIGSYCMDYMGVAVDPNDETHLYIATYGEGIIELKDNQFVNLYNISNSTLRSAIGDNTSYVRIGSVCYDNDGNLWSTNCLTKNALNVLKPDGTWVSLYYAPLNNADKIDKIMITSKGHKWVNIPYDNAGIFVLDDNGTLEDTSDDTYNFFSSFRDGNSSTGASISANEYICMVEDHNGRIWIGTNIGLLQCVTPSRAIDNPDQLSVTRLVRDNEAYFLNGESVTALAVDADNQKWIGTSSQGVFLINEDGTETIYHFNIENSPMLSNTISSIAIDDKTGEVFFGTDKGLVSYKSGVISGAKPFSDVYAFPNPVRPDFNDKVTITGLTNNASVKITDLGGNLIYQGHATGNRLVWNCRSANGNRVATGVYLVIAATSDGSESTVTKIAVVK